MSSNVLLGDRNRIPFSDRFAWPSAVLLLLVVVAAWTYVVTHSGSMAGPDMSSGAGAMDQSMDMGQTMGDASPAFTANVADLAAFVGAWAIMMAAMMLPALAPLVLRSGEVAPVISSRIRTFASTWLVALGYLAVWSIVGIPVYVASRGASALLAGNMDLAARVPYAIAALLVAVGLYQFAPAMRHCLDRCRNSVQALRAHWQVGLVGAFRAGVVEGMYSVGCCWALMIALVAAGSMGLTWVAAITLVVLAEKLLPRGQLLGRLAGVMLAGLGVVVAVQPQLLVLVRG